MLNKMMVLVLSGCLFISACNIEEVAEFSELDDKITKAR